MRFQDAAVDEADTADDEDDKVPVAALTDELVEVDATDELLLLLLPALVPNRNIDNRLPPPHVSLEFPCEICQSLFLSYCRVRINSHCMQYCMW